MGRHSFWHGVKQSQCVATVLDEAKELAKQVRYTVAARRIVKHDMMVLPHDNTSNSLAAQVCYRFRLLGTARDHYKE
jgi:hypothetical protein